MMFEVGDKVHVITRRAFEGDLRRHFAGQVLLCSEVTLKLEGYVFVFDPARNEFVRRPERRVRIFSLVDAANIVIGIPREVDLGSLEYETSAEKRLVITDGKAFHLDINEFGGTR